ncbi:hypothetical protein [Deefgea salmonis]|uniref:Peptidase C39 domain-containing protein n=1 Tax=Deefgea salmonis TaxID=2875502 RepID=A0ABS8BIZ4_9NEIS|nr:hypothetical protein [Deefgea salmonis]MCB5195688.1 hypothetical protein [Deefgea salmonis]
MTNNLVIHSNLTLGPKGPSVSTTPNGKKRPVYLQQSILDKACGPHCVYMALLIFKLLSRTQLMTMAEGDDETHIMFDSWLMAQDYWLHCTPLRGLVRIFAPFKDQLKFSSIQGSNKDSIRFLLDQHTPETLFIANIVNWRAHLDHWVLIIGVETSECGEMNKLYVLDPLIPPEHGNLHSSIVHRKSVSSNRYEFQDKSWTITINEVLAIHKKQIALPI